MCVTKDSLIASYIEPNHHSAMKQIFTQIITFVFTFIITAYIPTGCFPDWCIEPQIEENEDYHNLTIPSDGETYEIPFVSIYIKNHHTKMSVMPNYHQIRSRMIIDDSISEVFDAYLNDVVGYHFDSVDEIDKDKNYGQNEIPSTFVVNIPSNETTNSRSVVAQISIDRCENGSPMIDLLNVDTHDWGEWITILSGVQEGN